MDGCIRTTARAKAARGYPCTHVRTPEPPEARPKTATPTDQERKAPKTRRYHSAHPWQTEGWHGGRASFRAHRTQTQPYECAGMVAEHPLGRDIGIPPPTHRPAGELRNARRGAALSWNKRGSAPKRDQPRERRNLQPLREEGAEGGEEAGPGATASAGRRTELTQQRN